MMKSLTLILALVFAANAHAAQTITAQVNGMVCAFCAQGIEKKARALPQIQDVYVNLQQRLVAIEIKAGQSLSVDTVAALIRDAGYDISGIDVVEDSIAAIKARPAKE